jgi:hypothetical protein
MPSWIKLAGGWAVAAMVALAFSWGAVSQVRNRVIQPSIEIPTTVVAGAATIAPEPIPTTSSPTVIRVEPEVVDDTVTTVTEPGVETTSTTETTPTTTSQSGGGTTTTQPSSTTTTTSPTTTTTRPPTTTTTSTTTTTAAPPETQTSSYQLNGGTVTISHSPGVVTFVTAIPQPGFSTDLRETGPERVRVRLESKTHTSDFRAEWEGSELKITQNETGDD